MRFWFDTEFYEDGQTINLISIGVVAEDGREYYAETTDAKTQARKSAWLSSNVLPHLRGPWKTKHEIALDLIELMGNEPEIWAYYADYDWVVLCQLFGTMMDLPKGWPMYCRDLKQLRDLKGDHALPPDPENAHDALADAQWCEKAWRSLLPIPFKWAA